MNKNTKAKPMPEKTAVLAKKSRPAKDPFTQKMDLQARAGKDAETIRKEVLLAKEKLKKRQSFFEQMGSNDLLTPSGD